MVGKIPPHIFWPGMVVAILGLSVTANAVLVYQATHDGGAQIIEDYYDKAVAWDDQVELRRSSEAKGWKIEVVVGDPTVERERAVTFRVRDREGTPIQGLSSEVTTKNPARLRDTQVRTLTESKPGVYSALVPMERRGLYDIEFTVGSGEPIYLWSKRIEVGR